MTDSPLEKFTFEVWFSVTEDNDIETWDYDPSGDLNQGERCFGPYQVEIAMPPAMQQLFRDRQGEQPKIPGEVK